MNPCDPHSQLQKDCFQKRPKSPDETNITFNTASCSKLPLLGISDCNLLNRLWDGLY